MRFSTLFLTTVLGLALTGCTQQEKNEAAREAGREAHEAKEDVNSAARKAGKIAHEVAEDSKEAAEKAGHAIKKAAKEAKAGWNEAKRESKTEERK